MSGDKVSPEVGDTYEFILIHKKNTKYVRGFLHSGFFGNFSIITPRKDIYFCTDENDEITKNGNLIEGLKIAPNGYEVYAGGTNPLKEFQYKKGCRVLLTEKTIF